jgi:hypothetical protein
MAVVPRIDVDHLEIRSDLSVASHNQDLSAVDHWIDLSAVDFFPTQDLLLWVNTRGDSNFVAARLKGIWNRRAKIGAFVYRADLRNSF